MPLVVEFLVLTGCPSPNGSNGEPDLSRHIETVDTDGGSYTFIALDGSGRPHISYTDASGLKYTRYGE